MRKLLTLILMAAAFFGGYHFGHQPGSPDLGPFAQDCYAKAESAYHQVATLVKTGSDQLNSAPRSNDRNTVIDVDGKVVKLAPTDPQR